MDVIPFLKLKKSQRENNALNQNQNMNGSPKKCKRPTKTDRLQINRQHIEKS